MPVMSFMRQELPDSVLNETQSSPGQAGLAVQGPSRPPFPLFLLLFYVVSRMLVLRTQQLVRVDTFQIVS